VLTTSLLMLHVHVLMLYTLLLCMYTHTGAANGLHLLGLLSISAIIGLVSLPLSTCDEYACVSACSSCTCYCLQNSIVLHDIAHGIQQCAILQSVYINLSELCAAHAPRALMRPSTVFCSCKLFCHCCQCYTGYLSLCTSLLYAAC
jgi:hypothetical protein